MVSVRQPDKFYGLGQTVSGDFRTSAEWVTLALHDQRRRLLVLEMSCTPRFRFGRWMEGVPEADDAGDATVRIQLVGKHTGNPPTHGFSTDEHRQPGIGRGHHFTQFCS